MWIQVLVVIGVLIFLVVILIAVRKDRFRGGGAVGNALQEFHAAFDPGVKNTIEERRIDQVREDKSGAPPSDGKRISSVDQEHSS